MADKTKAWAWVLPTRRFYGVSVGVWSWPEWYIGSFRIEYEGVNYCWRFGPFGLAVRTF